MENIASSTTERATLESRRGSARYTPPVKTAADTFCFVALEDIGSSKWVAVERSWEWVAVATSPEAVVRLPGQVEMGILLDTVERAHRIWRRWDFTGGEATTHVWRHREVTLARWRGEPATEKKSIFGGPWQSGPKPNFFLGGGGGAVKTGDHFGAPLERKIWPATYFM
jgi:hypothetical protein